MKYYLLVFLFLIACAPYYKTTEQQQHPLTKHEMRWDKRATPISTVHTGLTESPLTAYRAAIDWIHEEIGCPVFQYPVETFNTNKQLIVYFTCHNDMEFYNWETGRNQYPEGHTKMTVSDDGYIYKAKMTIPCADPFPETIVKVAAHELLHVLGLSHDRELGTIMYHAQPYLGMKMQEQDRAVLRKLYCYE